MSDKIMATIGVAVTIAAGTSAFAQTAVPPPVQSSAPVPAAAQAVERVHVAEGTEVALRFNDHLSSATASEGDRFSVTLDEPVTFANGVVIPAGYRGVGEVTTAEHKGMMGKAGQLNVRLDYLSVGDTRVRLRASKGAQGKDSVGATVALTVLFGPIGLIKHGHDVEIQPGQRIDAFVDEPVDIPLPLTPPPSS